MKREVVVTGVGAVTPLGVGARTLYERWRAGASGIEDGVGRCSEFEPTEYLSKKEVRRADRFTQFALVVLRRGARARRAGTSELPYDPARIGCLIGTGIGGIGTLEHGKETLIEKGAEARLPARRPADDGQRRRRRRGHAPRAARPLVLDPVAPAPRARTRSARPPG